MTATPDLDHANQPAGSAVTYEVEVAGHLDDHWSDWLGGLALVRNDDASTTLTIDGADQAHLHGVLAGLCDLGVTLLSFNRTHASVGADNAAPPADSAEPSTAPAVFERPLRTERLTLRPATITDADDTWKYRRLESVNEWLTGALPDLEEYRTAFSEPGRLSTTVIVQLADEHGGAIVGDFMLRREDAWSQAEVTEQARGAQAELGWVLDPDHTGAGYATEAVRELLRYCFEDLGVHRVVANCFLDNVTSWRLMERVGMRRELHAQQDSLHRSGRWLDTVGYAVLAQEWKQHA